ncbi:hypothetical protein HNR19_000652 [Nocardioides thalensis]|uniref:Uncharacterized protein n=1 Tax=Nocardioides thalensis TaxID=1914755 RepID=A0A853BY23_9ACTN|nr:hypothetical protein [Nocardioides thalensis]NYI99953.1 hypothetical protein [Nocardioides thalensis]
MVATGARVRALAALLTGAGWEQGTPPRLPRLADLPTATQSRIRTFYDVLGGNVEHFDRIRPGGWDLAFQTPDGLLLVELDEEQHFNRYRAETLTAANDLDLPWATNYLTYCEQHEARLLPGWGTGQRWTNPSAARFFGDPSRPGDFTGNGAPRWRQRAFYDSVKDVLDDRRLARISVHDTLDTGATLERLLRRPDPTAVGAVQHLLTIRTHVA